MDRPIRNQQITLRWRTATCIVALIAALAGVRASAEDISWVGYQFGPPGGLSVNPFLSASFFHGDNWYGYQPPEQEDVAIFDEAFDPQGNGMPRDIYFGDFTMPAYPLFQPSPVFTPGRDAVVAGLVVRSGSFDFLFQDEHGTPQGSLMATGPIRIGDTASESASLSVYRGPLSSSEVIHVGYLGIGNLNVGSEAEVQSPWIIVGQYGQGDLRVESGGSVQSDVSLLGAQPSGKGEVTVTGSASTWNVGHLFVGDYGVGDLSVTAGAVVEGTVAWVGYTAGSHGTASIRSGGRWSVADGMTVGDHGNGELVVASGGEVESPWLTIGSIGNGSLEIQSGAAVENRWAHVGGAIGALGEVTVTGSGSKWTSSDELVVGYLGIGSLKVASGAEVESPWLFVGRFGEGDLRVEAGAEVESHWAHVGGAAGAFGEATVTGSGTKWTSTNDLLVGVAGNGRLTVSAGATVESNGTWIGYEVGSHGESTVADSGSALGTTFLQIGDFGTGLLTVTSGGEVESNYVYLGGEGHGEITVRGVQSKLTSMDELVLGRAGIGHLTAESGAEVHSDRAWIGVDPGSVGSALLRAGAAWTAGEFVIVGREGSGELIVESGATVATPWSNVGSLPGGAGTLLIDGAGSQVRIVDGALSLALEIGAEGSGVATVRNGGLLYSAGDVSLARGGAATGTLNVQGSGSKLRSEVAIFVGGSHLGSGNSGTINLTNAGLMETPTLVIYQNDTVNLETGGRAAIGEIGAVVSAPNTVTVGAEGRLTGIGTINGNVTNTTGGVLAPGTPIGRLAINGTLNHGASVPGAGGTLEIQVNGPGTAGVHYDTISVDGAALLGGTLDLVVAGGYVPNGADQFNVVVADSISGAFESIGNRVISGGGQGDVVWGDYRIEAAGAADDRYYVAPRQMGDFNGVGGVTGADFTIWADHFGQTWTTFGEGDANGDRLVTGADFTLWADSFGQSSFTSALGPIDNGNELAFLPANGDGAEYDVFPDADALAYPNAAGARAHGLGQAVPEPSAWLLLTLGAAGLGRAAYRARPRTVVA